MRPWAREARQDGVILYVVNRSFAVYVPGNVFDDLKKKEQEKKHPRQDNDLCLNLRSAINQSLSLITPFPMPPVICPNPPSQYVGPHPRAPSIPSAPAPPPAMSCLNLIFLVSIPCLTEPEPIPARAVGLRWDYRSRRARHGGGRRRDGPRRSNGGWGNGWLGNSCGRSR